MRLISPLLKRVVYPTLSAAGYLRPRKGSGQLAIVTYHGVLPAGYIRRDSALDGNLVSADDFRAQLRFLKNRYQVISPEALRSWLRKREPLPAFSILLTCDDGLQNNLSEMLPILREEGLGCLFFVTGASAEEARSMLWYEDLYLLLLQAPVSRFQIACAGVEVGGELGSAKQRCETWWNAIRRLSQLGAETREAFLGAVRSEFRVNGQRECDAPDEATRRRFGLLTAAELRQLAAAGMTIGAHTLSHPLLSQASPELAYAEIAESRTKLESVLNTPVWALAYPFGDRASVTPQVLAMAEKAGFEAAFMNVGGGFGTDLPTFALPRIHVTADMTLGEFEAHVSGFHRRLQERARWWQSGGRARV